MQINNNSNCGIMASCPGLLLAPQADLACRMQLTLLDCGTSNGYHNLLTCHPSESPGLNLTHPDGLSFA
jgi:hypothetical protein